MTVLSASLPPLKYSTTRLRRDCPCAMARSERKRGAANPTVNAETPPRTKSRLVMDMPRRLLNQLILARPQDQVDHARPFDQELTVRTRPGAAGAQVIEQRPARRRV